MSPTARVPTIRIRTLSEGPAPKDPAYVLYWMTGQRRPGWNFALQRAVEHAAEAGLPLVVLEALRCGYRYASDRHHAFLLQGMAAHAEAFDRPGVTYHPYVEPEAGAGKGLLAALSERAAAVVTDDWPAFFLPRMLAAAAEQVDVPFEAVDSAGLLPLHAAHRVFARAYDFRRFLQRELRPHLDDVPAADPLAGLTVTERAELPRAVTDRWAPASQDLLAASDDALAALPIDHAVRPTAMEGGSVAGTARLARFLDAGLPRYDDGRNDLDDVATSGLSPYLHYGHVGTHQILAALGERRGWSPKSVTDQTSGSRSGWWGAGAAEEAFLDQVVTWRELGFNYFAHAGDDGTAFESLPDWAQATLEEHASDRRPHLYDLEDFDAARTHDDLWNAAQTQLREEGVIHNYLRMLWGKKILHWSRTPREALATMLHLNDRYALDGRDPNSVSGITWVMGRYDRPWGPEREVFGKIRYMSSDNTRRKLRVKGYLERWGRSPGLFAEA